MWLGTYVETQHDDFEDVVGQGPIDLVHDQSLFISEARLSLDVGLTRRFAASLMLPVRLISTGIRYVDRGGNEVQLVQDGIHHRDETLSGLGDPMLLGAGSLTLGPARLTARAGASLPLGRTEEDPFAMPDIRHQHVQMGTGTVNPIVALEAVLGRGKWRFGGFAFTQQVVYENGKGYHAGDRYAAGVSVRRALGKVSLRGGLEMQAETAERWGGIVPQDDGNRGRLDLMVTGGASWAVGERTGVELDLKVPFVNEVVNGQLRMPLIVQVGASYSFGRRPKAKAAEDDHGHEHGDEHGHEHGDEHGDETPAQPDTAGLDVADVGTPGEAVDLVPVPNTITIFDFWATWCEPCKKLEPALVALVKEHPGKIALRRIDIVDWDSAATARYLTPGGFNLPHVKIFDASGKLLVERTPEEGKLDEMIEELHTLLDAEAKK